MVVRWRGTHVFDRLLVDDINWAYQRRANHVYYVDSVNGSDSNSGASWEYAKATFAAALDLAVDWDAIVLSGGDYTEDELQITQRGLKVIGINPTGPSRGPVLFIGEGNDHILELRNHDIEIIGVGFYQVAAYACVVIAELSENIWRCHIAHCGFSSSGTGTWGVYAGSIGAEAPYCVVEDCRFYNLASGGVYANSGAMVTRRNLFEVKASAVGIEDPQNSTSRPDRYILDNRFKTLDSTNAVGIKVTNTPSAGNLMIDGNHFIGFADNDHCISKRTGYTGLNYNGITAIPIT